MRCRYCDQLIVRAFDESSSKLDWKWRDEGENLIKALKSIGGEWTIRLSLQSDDVFMGKKIDEVRSFDLLQITAGEDENLWNEDDWIPHLPTVHLLLTSASG
ncbi:unnamed protein product [Parascedosporium putredinis]|uniref:Uncharacterized protein n=1 Tax=Parascedosporium putredinis TaxID=1442378 RepID=A0A9P1H017_9PEZI|nr:unnamed protein product [Parascedosporium putredinis]CAI7993457.1 unnamed protein product [Parascedosporium putredinis]